MTHHLNLPRVPRVPSSPLQPGPQNFGMRGKAKEYAPRGPRSRGKELSSDGEPSEVQLASASPCCTCLHSACAHVCTNSSDKSIYTHMAVAQQTGTQNGTLVSGNMDQTLRNPPSVILSHTHMNVDARKHQPRCKPAEIHRNPCSSPLL